MRPPKSVHITKSRFFLHYLSHFLIFTQLLFTQLLCHKEICSFFIEQEASMSIKISKNLTKNLTNWRNWSKGTWGIGVYVSIENTEIVQEGSMSMKISKNTTKNLRDLRNLRGQIFPKEVDISLDMISDPNWASKNCSKTSQLSSTFWLAKKTFRWTLILVIYSIFYPGYDG